LLDTSFLARLANSADAFHPATARAVLELHRRGEVLCVTAQNLIEFRGVASRPTTMNGLGFTPAQAEATATTFEAAFSLLPLERPVATLHRAFALFSTRVDGRPCFSVTSDAFGSGLRLAERNIAAKSYGSPTMRAYHCFCLRVRTFSRA
jgi:hypothetical protein